MTPVRVLASVPWCIRWSETALNHLSTMTVLIRNRQRRFDICCEKGQNMKRVDFNSLLVIALLFACASEVTAQTPANFSGKWLFDRPASSSESAFSRYPGSITRQITHTASSLAYKDTYVQPGAKDWSTTPEVFKIGKTEVEHHSDQSSTKSTSWSKDMKSITLNYLTSYKEKGSPKESLIAETYTLSDNGKTLTIEQYSKNDVTGETRVKDVFRKKQ